MEYELQPNKAVFFLISSLVSYLLFKVINYTYIYYIQKSKFESFFTSYKSNWRTKRL